MQQRAAPSPDKLLVPTRTGEARELALQMRGSFPERTFP